MTENNQNNSPIVNAILDSVRAASGSDIFAQGGISQVNLDGLAVILNEYLEQPKDADINYTDSNVRTPRLVYGTTWLSADNVNKIYERSVTDPGRILETFVIPTADGENGGVVGDTSNDQLSNILINGEPMFDPLAEVANYVGSSIKEYLGDNVSSTWDGIAKAAEIGETDPSTGESLSDKLYKGPQIKFEQLTNVNSEAPSTGDLKVFGESCEWENKNLAELLTDVTVTGADVLDQGSLILSDIKKWNYGPGLAVTADGDNQVYIDVIGSLTVQDDSVNIRTDVNTINFTGDITVTDGGSGIVNISHTVSSGGGSNTPGSSSGGACQDILIQKAPINGDDYKLMLGSSELARVTSDGTRTGLVNDLITEAYSFGTYQDVDYLVAGYNYTGDSEDEDFTGFKLYPGYDSCLGCTIDVLTVIHVNTSTALETNLPIACAAIDAL